VTSSWFFLSTLNYDARSTTHQIYLVCVKYMSAQRRNRLTTRFSERTVVVKRRISVLNQGSDIQPTASYHL